LAEVGDKDEERGIHAFFSLIFPVPQCWHLVCLCRACPRLLYWCKSPHPSPHCIYICVCIYIYIYINVLWKHFQVPNGVGVLLGSAQLILYAVYKNKSNIISTKSTEKMEEEGSAHLVKGIIQMQAFHEDDEEVLKNRSLNKGRSLPKPPVNRQYSFQRILKTFSLSPYEIHANYAHEDDVENGEKIHP
jgi:hypothetical protein